MNNNNNKFIKESDLKLALSRFDGSGGNVDDVKVNGTSVVTNKVANIDLQPYATEEELGINIWDEQWELGGYNWTTGTKTSETNRIRSKNFILVMPNKNYYHNQRIGLFYYDKNKNFLSSTNASVDAGEFSTPDNCYYILFMNTAVQTYANDTTINLSNPLYNGRYFASVGIRREFSSKQDFLQYPFFSHGTSAIADCNDAVESGTYYCSTSTLNVPVAQAGWLITFRMSASNIFQFWSRSNNATFILYFRKYQSSASTPWSVWKSITFA